MIKQWLNESDVFYTEGPISLNWSTVLSQIRSDIGGFIEGGGWSFLKENNDAGEDDDSEVGSDSNFDEEEDKAVAESGDDSDDSGGSDFSGASAESSSVKTNSDDEEGEDWDEMEKNLVDSENAQRLANLENARA